MSGFGQLRSFLTYVKVATAIRSDLRLSGRHSSMRNVRLGSVIKSMEA